MKNIIKYSIRLFLIFTIFNFINTFILSINNFVQWNRQNRMFMENFETLEFIKMYLPFIMVWIIYTFIIILLWSKSGNISEKIIEKNEMENMCIQLEFKSLLSLALIVLGIFFIIDTSPRLFSYIGNFVTSKTRFVDRDFLRNYTIREFIEMIGIIVKLLLAYTIIRHNRKIVDKIIAINEDKSNVT